MSLTHNMLLQKQNKKKRKKKKRKAPRHATGYPHATHPLQVRPVRAVTVTPPIEHGKLNHRSFSKTPAISCQLVAQINQPSSADHSCQLSLALARILEFSRTPLNLTDPNTDQLLTAISLTGQ